MSEIDTPFVARVLAFADATAHQVISGIGLGPLATAPLGPHREAMRRVKLLIACTVSPSSTYFDSASAIEAASRYVGELERMQATSGLFAGGDNVESAPDSGFTLNDVGDALELLRRLAPAEHADLAVVEKSLAGIAERAVPALLGGGVHTPNHRWELAAALTRLYRYLGDERLRARAEEWLAEGIDIDRDGLYSERSANYAVHVSNPSLLAMGEILDRPELLEHVERNLATTLGLIHPDRTVETVHSRRQDQKEPHFPLAGYLMQFRRLAVERQRADFAWAAELAEADGIVEPQTALTELLLSPTCGRFMPVPEPPATERLDAWRDCSLMIDTSPARRVVLYGGSDYSRAHRVRSGLANNPTLARLFAGDAVIDSIRLSREFFGRGPFRASSTSAHDGEWVFDEELSGAYYLPLGPASRRADGRYELEDEGRFAAQMSFSERREDSLTLHTRIAARPVHNGLDLELAIEGARVPWALEVAFRHGGHFTGAGERDGEVLRLVEGVGRYECGDTAIEFGPGTGVSAPARYLPGEEFEYLGGTDAVRGPRAYVTGYTPGVATISFRAMPRTERWAH